jgi:CheY-like chemotaxis protein
MGERLLRDEGHEVVTVTDGDALFGRLADVDPDVLVLDAALPLRDGYEIARFIKSSEFYRHASVVLTGSLADPVDEARAKESGADGVVQKPFDARVLSALIGPLAVRSEKLRHSRPTGPPPPFPGSEPLFVSGPTLAEPEPEFAPLEEEYVPPAAPALAPLGVKSTPELAADPAPVQPLAEEERVRAAVTLALDAALPKLIDELTRQTLRALHSDSK